MLEENVFRRRLDEIRNLVQRKNADFAFITPSPNYQYLTGYAYEMHERLVALLVRPDDDPCIIVPAFETSDHARNTWIREIVPWNEDENPYNIIADFIGKRTDGVRVLLDDTLPLGIFRRLAQKLGGIDHFDSLTPYLERMRQVKSNDEIKLMKEAGKIIDKAVMNAFQQASVGMTELEVRQVVLNEIACHGASQTFAAIQFDKNTALPHARSGDSELRPGNMVLMDCGCTIAGYHTDMTRVGVVGEPTDEQKRIHSIVLHALETAIERIGPGTACGAADGFARKVIQEAGYGEYFTHRLGHGIGLEVHEPPYLVRGNSQVLEQGMTHSIEPGIYLEGKFGVRIEDLAAITSDGLEVLTYSPKDLFIIDIR